MSVWSACCLCRSAGSHSEHLLPMRDGSCYILDRMIPKSTYPRVFWACRTKVVYVICFVRKRKARTPLLNRVVRALSVELAGVEPASKQGNHTLSTRLFQTLVFVRRQDLDHPPTPYPLKFHLPIEALTNYFRFTCTAWSSDSEQHPWSDVSSCHLVTGLSQ